MMKTIYSLMIAVALLAATYSCSGSGSSGSVADTSSVRAMVEAEIDTAQCDSIAFLLGTLLGNDRAHDFVDVERDTTASGMDRKDFLRGMRIAVNDNNRSASYTMGVQAAHEILLKLRDFEGYNVKINRELLLAAIERQLRADSISDADLAAANTAYNELLQRIYSTEQR